MASPFAQQLNDTGRPLLWRVLGEDITYRNGDGDESPLTVIWKRVNPQSDTTEPTGADSFYADAMAVVHIADLPEPDGQGDLIRDGEAWSIRLVEMQDEWTWILHLSRARDEISVPTSLR